VTPIGRVNQIHTGQASEQECAAVLLKEGTGNAGGNTVGATMFRSLSPCANIRSRNSASRFSVGFPLPGLVTATFAGRPEANRQHPDHTEL